MNHNLPAIIQDSKVVLTKSKNLIGITNKILATRSTALADVLIKKPYISLGHTGRVHSVAFSPDGATVISGSEDGTLKLWDVRSGACIRTFEGYTEVWLVAFSPDGATVLSGDWDYTLKLWDVRSGACIRTFEGHTRSVRSVAFSPDGATVLSGSIDKTLKLWDVRSGACIRTFEGHTDWVASVAFSPDGATVLSGSEDKTLKLWDVQSGACIRTFEGHTRSVRSVAFSPDGATVLSGSNTLKLWDVQSGECIWTLEGHRSDVESVAFSPDGATVLLRGDNTLKLWDVRNGECIRTFEWHTDSVRSVAFSPDGATVLSGSYNKTLKLWDARSGECIRTFEGHAIYHFIDLLPDGRTVLLKTSKSTLSLFDISQDKEIKTFDVSLVRDNLIEYEIISITLCPDGKKILLRYRYLERKDNVSYYGEEFFDICLGESRNVASSAEEICISNDTYGGNSLILKMRWGRDKRLKGHSLRVTSAVLSPDGKRVLSGSEDKTLKLWDVQSGACIRTFEGHTSSVASVAFSPDGATVLSGDWDGTLKLWDISTGSEIRTFQGYTNGIFSPDGKTILARAKYITLKLLDVKTGRTIRTFEGHTCLVDKIAFSHNGEMAFSGSSNETLILWNIKTGTWLMKIIAYENGERVAITHDGYFNHTENGRKYLAVHTSQMGAEEIDDATYNHYYRPNGFLINQDSEPNLPISNINEDEIPF